MEISKDASRVLLLSAKSLDPAHPVAGSGSNPYDVTAGTPHLVSLMPDGSVPACGSALGSLSADGSLLFFQSCGAFYVRDIDAEQTKLVSPGNFNVVTVTPAAVFLKTDQSIDPVDTGGTDVYRYDIGTEALKCVTCVVPARDANVDQVAIADDGSRVYFKSSSVLLPGAATPGIYRVDVASRDIAYVAPALNTNVETNPLQGQALTPDGSALIFVSNNLGLNALGGGQQNGGTLQYYRYGDRDRSLICLSCPQDGSAPLVPVLSSLVSGGNGANTTAISADGQTFGFATATPLLRTDQNTARPGQATLSGTDVYEWRDGRLLLVTDGLSNWAGSFPGVTAITPSGRDIFFTAPAQYTQDALDGYPRLYDARIGGGFEFPPPPKPCPLEVCQGTPKGAPEERAPGTGTFAGPGNEHPRTHKKKQKHRKKSHKKQGRHAKHNRGVTR